MRNGTRQRLFPLPVPDLSVNAGAWLHFQLGSFGVYLQAKIRVAMTQSVVLKNSHDALPLYVESDTKRKCKPVIDLP